MAENRRCVRSRGGWLSTCPLVQVPREGTSSSSVDQKDRGQELERESGDVDARLLQKDETSKTHPSLCCHHGPPSQHSCQPSIMSRWTQHSGFQVLSVWKERAKRKGQLRLTRTIAIVVDWWRDGKCKSKRNAAKTLSAWRKGSKPWTTSTSLSLEQAYIARGLPPWCV